MDMTDSVAQTTMSEIEAWALTREIQATGERFWTLIQLAYKARAWEAIGYEKGAKGWTRYCKEQLGKVQAKNKLTPEARREILAAWLTDEESPMSLPAAAAGVGVSVGTLHNDKVEIEKAGVELPDNVASLDNKRRSRSASAPKAKDVAPKLVIPPGIELFAEMLLRVEFTGDAGLTSVELDEATNWWKLKPGLSSSYLSRAEKRGLVRRTGEKRNNRVAYSFVRSE